jgi:hypothetical protein
MEHLQMRVLICSAAPSKTDRPSRLRRVETSDSSGKLCPILSGAISGNQDLKYPYLGEILDVLPKVFAAISAT